MANIGKYRDTLPNIPSAGRPTLLSEPVRENLRYYTLEDCAEAIWSDKCRAYIQSHTPLKATPSRGVSRIKHETLVPESYKGAFDRFREDFFEALYMKKVDVGQPRIVGSLPDGVRNDSMTFGTKIKRDEPLYELLLPHRSRTDIQLEALNGHQNYLISHNSYFPSERISRHYTASFDPHATFGEFIDADRHGRRMERVMRQCDQVNLLSERQERLIYRNYVIGQRMPRFKDIHPDEFGHSRITADCDIVALVEQLEPWKRDRRAIEASGYVYSLRHRLLNNRLFFTYDLQQGLRDKDTDGTGQLRLNDVFQVLRNLNFSLDEEKLRHAFKYYNLLIDADLATERINSADVWKLLEVRYPLPKAPLPQSPITEDNKLTTYRELCNARTQPLPAERQDIHFNPAPGRVSHLLTPDIYMSYDLEYKDFQRRFNKSDAFAFVQRAWTSAAFEQMWQRTFDRVQPADGKLSLADIRTTAYEMKVF